MVDQDLDWMSHGPLSLLDNLHRMPKHLEKLLSKFDPDKKVKVDDHLDDLYMHLRMLYVQYDDVDCRLFPFNLEGKASVWYHSMPVNSIHGWREFKKLFLEKFSNDKNLSMLLKELINIKMVEKEKAKITSIKSLIVY